MDRGELLAILKKVSPALSARDLIPIFSCFCFTEKSVHAYDDVVALRYPINLGIRGGIRGALLMNWLSAARSKELDVSQDGQEAIIKAGRAKLTTPILPEDDFLFKIPEDRGEERDLDEKFLGALSKASLSLGRDPSNPWRLGVTVVFGDTGTLFYASDNATVARVRVGKPFDEGDVVVLPPRFVELLQEIGKVDPPTKLYLAKDHAEARFTSGLRLFSKTITASDVDTFASMFKGLSKQHVDLPNGLDRALERAVAVTPFSKDPFTKITATSDPDNRLKLATNSEAGNVRDIVALPAEMADAEIEIVPEQVLRGLPHADAFAVKSTHIELLGKDFTYLISAVTRGGAKKDE